MTLTVKDIPEDIHVVSGQVIYVQGKDGSTVGPVSGADVTIVRGTKTLSRTTTDADGNFSLAGVPSGEYNIVVKVNTNPAKTVTAKLLLTTEDKDVQMSAIKVRTEDINSELDVSQSPFDIVVGGLDRLAESVFDSDEDASSVTASMTIDQPATDGNDPHQKAIREKAGGKTLDLLNLALSVQGSDQQSGNTLELIIPYDTSRSGIKVYRSLLDANGKVIAEELADSAVEIGKQSGCIRLTIPADQLGLYAIGYTPASTGGGGSSVKKDDTVKSAGTGEMGLLPYAVMALGTCTGTVVLRFRRKRED